MLDPEKIQSVDLLCLFLRGYVKDTVYIFPNYHCASWNEGSAQEELEMVLTSMPSTAWSELDYQNDVCRLTHRAHIESL